MGEKQTQQHSQHFNLSGEAKQQLEQLTARRYPGKKRRQSQLVEDLITQAFAKEYGMSTTTTAMQEPEPDWLAPFTQEALDRAQQEAHRFKATEVTAVHLLLGLVTQGDKGVLDVLTTLRVNISTLRNHLDRLLTSEHRWHPPAEHSKKLEWREQRREELFNELKPGEVRRGVVSQLANFGAFVDLGGAHGLVHISQLTWSPINHPSEVVQVGQEVEVQVLSIDKEKKKIALSIKRTQVDPWTTFEERYAPGQLVTGIVTKIAPFGAFARIEEGIEGLIQLADLPSGFDPQSILREGAQLQLRILRIDSERHRLGLSLRLAEEPDGNATAPKPPLIEADMKHGAGEIEKILAEEFPAASEEVAVPDVGAFRDSLPLSSEVQVSIHGALWIAKRMHSPLVEPEHLFLSILQNQRIQDALAPLLPFPEMLSSAPTGPTSDTSRQENSCPLCKRLVQSHWRHCVYCGQLLASACAQCGAPRAEVEDALFCYKCGSPLE